MAEWQVQEAKTRLSELMERAENEGPQTITKHGRPKAVVVAAARYEELTAHEPTARRRAKDPFVEHLLNIPKVEDFEIERDKDTGESRDGWLKDLMNDWESLPARHQRGVRKPSKKAR